MVLLNVTLSKILLVLGSGGSGNRLVINALIIVLFLSGTLHYLLTWDKQKIRIKSDFLIIKKGNKSKSYPLGTIDSVYLEQNWLGKIFNYGNIKINLGQDGENLNLSHLEAPNKFISDLKN